MWSEERRDGHGGIFGRNANKLYARISHSQAIKVILLRLIVRRFASCRSVIVGLLGFVSSAHLSVWLRSKIKEYVLI